MSVRSQSWEFRANAIVVITAMLLRGSAAVADTNDGYGANVPTALTPVIQSFFVTESVFPQQPGELQLRLGSELSTQSHSTLRDTSVSIGLEYGVTSKLQISADVPWHQSRDVAGLGHDGLGPLSVGMLYNAFAPSREPAMSLLLEVTAPSAGEPEEDSGTQVQFLIILASSFDALQVHLNLGGELTDGGDSAVLLGAGVLLQAGPLTPTIELSASTSAQETTLNIVPGLHWRANASTDLSIGASAGIAGSNQFAILSAVTVEF